VLFRHGVWCVEDVAESGKMPRTQPARTEKLEPIDRSTPWPAAREMSSSISALRRGLLRRFTFLGGRYCLSVLASLLSIYYFFSCIPAPALLHVFLIATPPPPCIAHDERHSLRRRPERLHIARCRVYQANRNPSCEPRR
jgi:hypothetical protein